jgi:DNA-binding GntR family transcriptional regulator
VAPLATSKALLPVKHRLLTEEVTSVLRQAIIDGTLAGGERIVEAVTAERLGVSRVPVREALAELLKEGLVVPVGARGTCVRDFTLQDLGEIVELRQTLEVMAIKILCLRISDTDATELDAEIQRGEAETTPEGVGAADVRFHQRLLRATQHSRLIESWNNLRAQIEFVAVRVHRGVLLASRTLGTRRMAVVHRDLMRLLRAGDVAQAVPFIEEHISSNRDAYLKYFELDRRARGTA